MPPPMTNLERQALRNMTNEQHEATGEYFKNGDYNAHLKKTSGEPASTTKSSTSAGTKRKSAEITAAEVDLDDIDVGGMYVDKSCNQVRGQIRRFLEAGEMKVGEFCSAIGVSNKSLNDFLRQNGTMKGSGSATYSNAWAFFKKQEIAGLKMPTKKAKTASTAAGSGNSSASPFPDISGIFLDGEDERDVDVFDTCDEIRKKINAHLMKPGVTQAQFCRDLTDQLHGTGQITTSQLTTFRSKKGPSAGATSGTFYAAYVFFEKVRLAEGKPKSKHRKDMEDAWPRGFDREHDANTRYWCGPGESIHEDSLGRVTFK